MRYRDIEYTVVQGLKRGVWKWSTSVGGTVVSGKEPNKAAAVVAVEKTIDRAKFITETVMQPLSALTTDIISTSWECTQAIKPHLRPNDAMKNHPENQIAYTYFTFLAFFIRLINVEAFNAALDRDAFLQLKDAILSMIVPSQSKRFSAILPTNRRSNRCCAKRWKSWKRPWTKR